MDAKLVLHADAEGVVAQAGPAIRIGNELRHQEHRNALHPRRRIRQPREDDVDDIVGHVVLAEGNEYLLAEQAVGAVVAPLGPGPGGLAVDGGDDLGQVLDDEGVAQAKALPDLLLAFGIVRLFKHDNPTALTAVHQSSKSTLGAPGEPMRR